MAIETLKLSITADNKQAINALKETTGQLDVTGKAALKTGTQLGTLSKGSNQAGSALQNLGRIAQDAPFGFIGIQNNLNPLLESFQRLKVETGSTGGALKALAGSMMGAGGIGLALSLASSLFLVFGDSIFSAGKKAKEAKTALDDINDSIAKDAAQIRILVGAYDNANISQTERVGIIKELQRLAPEQFANLSAEKTTYEQLTKALDSYNNSLSNQIRAKVRTQELEALIKQEEPLKKLVKLQEDFAMRMKTGVEVVKAQGQLNTLLEKEKALEEDINRLVKPKAATQALVNKGVDETIEKYSKLNEYLKFYSDFYKNRKEIGGGLESTPFTPPTTNNAPQSISAGNGSTQTILDQFANLTTTNSAWKLYNEYVTQAASITNVAAQAFTDLGNAMLQGQNLGDALGNVFKKLASDIAAAAIKALIFKIILSAVTGGGSTAADLATKGGGGLGSFAKLFGGFLGIKMATGGITQGPTPALIGEAGPEAVLPLSKLGAFIDRAAKIGASSMGGNNQQMTIGEFKLVGSDLIMAINRSNNGLGLRRGG